MGNTETTYVSQDERVIEFDDALSRAWSNIRRAAKDGTDINKRKADGSARKYVTLAAVDEAIRDALTAEGFTYPQPPSTKVDERGQIWIVIHTQIRRRGVAFVPEPYALLVQGGIMKGGDGFKPPTAQDMGSALTYARRYALTSVFGVCPDEDDDGHAASRQPDHDPAWERLQGLTADLARALRCSSEDAAARVKRQAGEDLGTIGSNGPTDAQVATLTVAAQELLEFVRNPPREIVTPDAVIVDDKPKARGKGKPSAKPPAEQTAPVDPPDLREARASFQSAYKHYQAECREQGVDAKPWMDLASEAIGETWTTAAGSHPAEHYILAADMCEQAIERLRTGGKAA
jgi:hypothetical protein